MEDVAYFFRWSPSEVYALTPTQLDRWYQAAIRINKEQNSGT